MMNMLLAIAAIYALVLLPPALTELVVRYEDRKHPHR